jgi:hypothetical protein
MSVRVYTGAIKPLIKVQKVDKYGVLILILGGIVVGKAKGGEWN